MPFGFRRGRGGRRGWGRGRGFRGGRGPRGFGPGNRPANCICPKCGMISLHQLAIPCFQTRCPRCSSFMTRQFSYEE